MAQSYELYRKYMSVTEKIYAWLYKPPRCFIFQKTRVNQSYYGSYPVRFNKAGRKKMEEMVHNTVLQATFKFHQSAIP